MNYSLSVANGFGVDLGDEGAGGVDGGEATAAGVVADSGADTVCGEDDDFAFGDEVEAIDEADAFVDEAGDDVFVVNDFVVDVDGGVGEEFDDLVNDIDGHADAGAEAAGVDEDELHVDGNCTQAGGERFGGRVA